MRESIRADLRRGPLSVDRVVFREPVHVGELVTFSASVNYTGRTSMEIGIRVETEASFSENLDTPMVIFTMVAMGSDGKPAGGAPNSGRPGN